MDLSNHAKLASRFATLALVFSVSACVLSQSMAEDQPGEPAKATAADTKQPEATTPAKNSAAVKSTPAKPGSLRAANQKVSKLATDGKLDKNSKKKPTEPQRKVVTSKKVVRYVSADTLNVRMHSSMDAPVVGKLTRGTMYHVSIEGSWAKIGDNQYVMTKFLSSQPPKRVGSNWSYRK